MNILGELQRLEQQEERISRQILTEKEKLAQAQGNIEDEPSKTFFDTYPTPPLAPIHRWHLLVAFAVCFPLAMLLMEKAGIVTTNLRSTDIPWIIVCFVVASIIAYLIKDTVAKRARRFHRTELLEGKPKNVGWWIQIYNGSSLFFICIAFNLMEIAACFLGLKNLSSPSDDGFIHNLVLFGAAALLSSVNICLAINVGVEEAESEVKREEHQRKLYELKTSDEEHEIKLGNKLFEIAARQSELTIAHLEKDRKEVCRKIRKLEWQIQHNRSSASDSSTPNNFQGNGKANPEHDRVDHPIDWIDRSL